YVGSENEATPWRLPDSLRERVPSFVHTEPNSAVHVTELEFAIRPPNNQDVTLGQTISIDCAAKPSDLQPVVEWKYLQKSNSTFNDICF
ncbi:unnamed protein product, partial [Trichobilharzia regenti]